MDNMQPPPGDESQDFWATQDLVPAAGPPGPAGPGWGQPHGQAGHQPSGPSAGQRSPRRRGGRALWWGTGLALVAVLAGGGAIAATSLASNASQASPGPTGQAAVLNTVLSSASSSTSAGAADSIAAGSATPAAHPCRSRAAKLRAAGHPFAARVALWRCRHPLRRIRVLGGIHGQFTFQTKSGPRTLAYSRGVIESVSGSEVVVQASDNTTWTWILESNTVVRENGHRVTTSALSDGEHVFAGGPVVSSAYDARLVVITAASGSSSSGSSSSGSSVSGS